MTTRDLSQLLIAFAAATLVGTVPARAQTTWYVDDNAPDDPCPGNPNCGDPLEGGSSDRPFDAIQEGIDAATDGDTVLVASGVYLGTGNKDINYFGKAILVRSTDGPLTCIIDCEHDARGFHFGWGETPEAVLAGFTITNGSAEDGGAVRCQYGSSPTIRDCILVENQAERGGAVYSSQSSPMLMNCAVVGNSAEASGGGVLCREGTITIANCTVADNSAAVGGGGAQVAAASEMTVVNTIFTGNEAPAGPELRVLGSAQPSTLTITYSDVHGGQPLIDVAENCTLVWGDGNITDDPMLTGNGTHLLADSSCIDAGDTNAGYADQTDVDGEPREGDDRIDMGADEFYDVDEDGLPDWWEELYFGSPTAGDAQADENVDGVVNLDEYALGTNPLVDGVTYYVNVNGDSRWDGRSPVWDGQHGPKRTIQAGIDLAVDGDGETVIIADGVYTGDGNKNLDFRGAAITVRSANGCESCIIDCELDGRGFHFHSGETSASVLEGITITNAEGPNYEEPREAILCQTSNPTIRNCSIVDNQDGGIYCYDSDITVEECHIARNRRAGIWSEYSAVTVAESTITDNSPGIYLYCGSGTIACCEIEGNGWYGGIHAQQPDSLLVADSIIQANQTSYSPGAAIYCVGADDLIVEDCVVSGNNADFAGGISFHSYGPQRGLIDRCTIVGNTAYYGGGGIRASSEWAPNNTLLTVRDCYIAGNTAGSGGGLSAVDYANVSVVRTRIEENTATYGGGVCTGADHFEAVQCRIRGNVAEEHGGGVYSFHYGWPVQYDYLDLTNCVLADNMALEGDGGGIGCEERIYPITLRNCTIVRNEAGNSGGGMYCVTEIDVANSVFCGNQADLGSQLAIEEVDDPAGETLTFSDVAGGPSGIHVATGTLGWHESNIDADPLFVDADGPDDDPNTWQDNDYHLSPGSPCIDAADNTAVPLDTLDLDGDGDFDEPTPFDLDARLRFADRIAAPDAGNPDPNFPDLPIVDMGAYEYQCTGDLDGNGQINLADLAQLLGSYGETAGMTYHDGDLDADADVDLADLAELLGAYGTTCS